MINKLLLCALIALAITKSIWCRCPKALEPPKSFHQLQHKISSQRSAAARRRCYCHHARDPRSVSLGTPQRLTLTGFSPERITWLKHSSPTAQLQPLSCPRSLALCAVQIKKPVTVPVRLSLTGTVSLKPARGLSLAEPLALLQLLVQTPGQPVRLLASESLKAGHAQTVKLHAAGSINPPNTLYFARLKPTPACAGSVEISFSGTTALQVRY
jgi:hypothetical protein